VRVAVEVPGVQPDQAFAWWTDFREGAHDHAFARFGHPDRRVEVLGQGRVRVTESGKLLGWQFREVSDVELAKPRVRLQTTNNFGRFRATYRFLPSQAGTTIELVLDITAPGKLLRWTGPFGRWGVKRFVRWDLRMHAKDLRREAAGPQT
jgi:hypothetical protein